MTRCSFSARFCACRDVAAVVAWIDVVEDEEIESESDDEKVTDDEHEDEATTAEEGSDMDDEEERTADDAAPVEVARADGEAAIE